MMQAVVDSILGNAKEALKTVSREAFNNTIKWINGVSAVVVSIIPGAMEGSTWSSFTHPTMPRWMDTISSDLIVPNCSGVSDFNRMVSEFTHSDQNLLSESGSDSDSDSEHTSIFSHHTSRHGLFRRSRRFISGMFGRSPHPRRGNGHVALVSPLESEQGSTHPSRRVSGVGGLVKSGSEHSFSRRMSDVWHTAFPFSDRNRSAQRGLLEELQFQLERLIDWSFETARGVTYYILSPSEGLRLIFWRLQGLGRSQSHSSLAREEEQKVTTVEQIIIDAGYPYETHRVVTDDGYILRLERIPRKDSRRAVFLQHGLLDSALGWVANGVVGSQAFAAYDQGYDVWLGNFRGYTSREHVNPNMSKREYVEHTKKDLKHGQNP